MNRHLPPIPMVIAINKIVPCPPVDVSLHDEVLLEFSLIFAKKNYALTKIHFPCFLIKNVNKKKHEIMLAIPVHLSDFHCYDNHS